MESTITPDPTKLLKSNDFEGKMIDNGASKSTSGLLLTFGTVDLQTTFLVVNPQV